LAGKSGAQIDIRLTLELLKALTAPVANLCRCGVQLDRPGRMGDAAFSSRSMKTRLTPQSYVLTPKSCVPDMRLEHFGCRDLRVVGLPPRSLAFPLVNAKGCDFYKRLDVRIRRTDAR
jgi:hypothetical protein